MYKWMSKKRNQKGFTLIELIVVIAILGVLAAIAIPRFTDVTANAKRRTHNTNVRILESAAQLYIAEHPGTAVTTTNSATTLAAYVKEWPVIPTGLTNTTTGNPAVTGPYTVEIDVNGGVTVLPALIAMQ